MDVATDSAIDDTYEKYDTKLPNDGDQKESIDYPDTLQETSEYDILKPTTSNYSRLQMNRLTRISCSGIFCVGLFYVTLSACSFVGFRFDNCQHFVTNRSSINIKLTKIASENW